MKTIKTLLLVALLAMLTNACSTEEATPERTKLLTQNTWTFSSTEGFDEISKAIIEAFADGSSYKFKTDGTVNVTFFGISYSSDWEFNSDQTIIILEPGTEDEQKLVIVTLNETTLKVRDETNGPTTGSMIYTSN